MGGNAGDDVDIPVHKVTLTRNYYISTTEITFVLFDLFWKETQTKVQVERPDWLDRPYDFGYGRGERPVIDVSWYEAVQFCNWLSQKEGLPPAYVIGRSAHQVTWNQKSTGYRLPTEAEWEFAARGGLLSKGFRYAGSDNPDEVAWYFNNAGRMTHLVAMKKANEKGLYDMSGNVGELCWDWLEYNSRIANDAIDPIGPRSGDFKVVRGGAHISDERDLRTAYRYATSVDGGANDFGIRIVRYSQPTN
jgi:formylglycine-generating enzyme required for sulfatase activity